MDTITITTIIIIIIARMCSSRVTFSNFNVSTIRIYAGLLSWELVKEHTHVNMNEGISTVRAARERK